MPIGVPKVAFRLPGESVPQWLDIYNRLYRARVIFLGSELDDELANQLVGVMLYLSAENQRKGLDLSLVELQFMMLCIMLNLKLQLYVWASQLQWLLLS